MFERCLNNLKCCSTKSGGVFVKPFTSSGEPKHCNLSFHYSDQTPRIAFEIYLNHTSLERTQPSNSATAPHHDPQPDIVCFLSFLVFQNSLH